MNTTNLSYEAYRTNPAIREALDADVRRMRAEAVRQYIVDPIVGAVRSVRRALTPVSPVRAAQVA